MATKTTKKKSNQNYSARLADGRRVTVKNGVKTYTPAPTTKATAPKTNTGGGKTVGQGAPLTPAQQAQVANIKTQALQIQDQINLLKQKEAGTVTDTSITSDSTSAVNAENQILSNIEDLKKRSGLSGDIDDQLDPLYKLQRDQARMIDDERDRLADRRASEIEGINAGFDVNKTDTEFAQSRETGQTSMDLARAGGYLGVTASQSGVLQNLVITQRQEMLALEAQRQEAIRAANDAYEDRDFELARELLQSARDLEKEVTTRRNNFLNQQLDIMGEQRAQFAEQRLTQEFKYKLASDRVDRLMETGVKPNATDMYRISQDVGISPAELTKIFEAGQATKALEDSRDRTERDVAKVNALRGVPRDQYVTIDGVTYRGLAELSSSGSGGTATERETARQEQFKAMLMEDLRGGVGPDGSKIEPITYDEALKTYPELNTKTIEEIFKTLNDYDDKKELDANIAAGKWDIIIPMSDSGTVQPAIIYDKAAYKAALEEWQTSSKGGWFDIGAKDEDMSITFDGKTYTGTARIKDKDGNKFTGVYPEDYRITQ